MNEVENKNSPTLLLLILLVVSAGLLLLNTLTERIENGGLAPLRSQQSSQEKAYQQIP